MILTPKKFQKKIVQMLQYLKKNEDFFPHEKLEKLSSKVARNS